MGKTPMVRITKIIEKKGVEIYAKLEGFNPTGSIKDRIAIAMIEKAEKDGLLKNGKTIIEATSGNTGISLAMAAAVKGYPIEIAISAGVSPERIKILKAFGAEVILTNKNLGTDGAITKVKELIATNPEKYYSPDQFSNLANPNAHFEKTAREIWKQTNGEIDYFVAGIGSSGTLMGIGRYLKEMNPNVKIIAAHPTRGHKVQGLKNLDESLIPAIYNRNVMDEIIEVKDEPAFEFTRKLIRKEGLFVGISSGAALYVASKIAERITTGKIVVIFPDRGEKYLSTELFNF
ncbi:MAG: cysteine synthase family protein [Candidatus Micrarchaeota archaeon]